MRPPIPLRLAFYFGLFLALPALAAASPPPDTRPSPLVLRATLLYAPAAPLPNRTATLSANAFGSLPLASPPSTDPWLGFDKVQHAAFSFLWTLGGQYALVNKADWSEGAAWPVSASVAGAVGVAKEVLDWRVRTGHFSRRDLVADAVGVALGVGFILL